MSKHLARLTTSSSHLVKHILDRLSALAQLIQANRQNKLVFTVSVCGICGLSIAANYYFRLLSIRKKRVLLNKSRLIIEMVRAFFLQYFYVFYFKTSEQNCSR